MKYVTDQGSNNWDEFFALWILLNGEKEWGLKALEDFGWLDKSSMMHKKLHASLNHELTLGKGFLWFYPSAHVYWEFNTLTNSLSK